MFSRIKGSFACAFILCFIPLCWSGIDAMAAKEMISAEEVKYVTKLAGRRDEVEQRKRRIFSLDNGLEILLIEDARAQLSSAALNVNVGFLSDPENRPGMAHYLEHVILMGSEKYRKPEAYLNFFERNGGESNASTTEENTNFHFSIANEVLEEGLDRLADALANPLFDGKWLRNEVDAIEAEYKDGKDDEEIQIQHLFRKLINPNHPYSKVFQGNAATLSKAPRKDIVAFYGQHYSADRMKLVLISSKSLDELESLVRKKFSGLKRFPTSSPDLTMPLFLETQQPQLIQMQSHSNRNLVFLFPIPSPRDFPFSQPSQYLVHFLSRTGPQSLIHRLKELGWIEDGMAQVWESTPQATLAIHFMLTENGYKNWKRVGEELFSSLKYLEQEGLGIDYFESVKRRREVHYVYSSVYSQEEGEEEGFEEAFQLSSTLRKTTFSELDSEGLSIRYSPAEFSTLLEQLNPSRVQVILSHPKKRNYSFHDDFYDLNYSQEVMPGELLDAWASVSAHTKMEFPLQTRFQPIHYSFIGEDLRNPIKLRESDILQLWVKTDHVSRVPLAQVVFQIILPLESYNYREYALYSAFESLVQETLDPLVDDASEDGFTATFEATSLGFEIALSGYPDKLEEFSKAIFSSIQRLSVTQVQYASIQKRLVQDLKEERFDSPQDAAHRILERFKYSKYPDSTKRLSALKGLGMEEFESFMAQPFSRALVKGLGFGNISAPILEAITQHLFETFNIVRLEEKFRAQSESVFLPQCKSLLLHDQISGACNASLLHYQFGPHSWNLVATTELASRILSAPFFESMRTQKRLGYSVYSDSDFAPGATGFNFLIQSSGSVKQAEKASEQWVQTLLLPILKAVPLEEFESMKSVALKQLNSESQHFTDRYEEARYTVFQMNGDSAWKNERNRAFEEVSLNAVIQEFEKAIHPSSQRKISVMIEGSHSKRSKRKKRSQTLQLRLESEDRFQTDVDKIRKSLPSICTDGNLCPLLF